jgi:hypothetical protein
MSFSVSAPLGKERKMKKKNLFAGLLGSSYFLQLSVLGQTCLQVVVVHFCIIRTSQLNPSTSQGNKLESIPEKKRNYDYNFCPCLYRIFFSFSGEAVVKIRGNIYSRKHIV